MADVSTHEETSSTPPADHEDRDINMRGFFWIVAIFVGSGIVLYVGLWAVFRFLNREEAKDEAKQAPTTLVQAARQTVPPEPRLQSNPPADMDAMRRDEDRILTTAGWVDRSRGVVRIPITDAMQLALQRGIYKVIPADTPSAAAGGAASTQPPAASVSVAAPSDAQNSAEGTATGTSLP